MSATNGHLPEGATIATIEELLQINTQFVQAPSASRRAGRPIFVKIRPIRAIVYMELQPPPPPGSEKWPSIQPDMSDDQKRDVIKERIRLYQEWEAALPAAAREARTRTGYDIAIGVVAAGLVEPAMSMETARILADDVDIIARDVLVLSGLVEAPKAEEKKAVEAAVESEPSA